LTAQQATFRGYIALVALSKRLGADLASVVLVQMALSLVAAAALYDLGTRLSGQLSGILAAGLFVANPDIARWNAFILTDSVYTSLVAIFAWCLHRTGDGKLGESWLLAVIAVFAATMRPHGWTLAPLALIYIVAGYRPRLTLARTITVCVSIAGVAGLLVLWQPPRGGVRLGEAMGEPGNASHALLNLISSGVVLWGYEDWRLPMPLIAENDTACSYAFSHPLAVAKLAGARVAVEIVHARPFYSLRHNAVIAVYLTCLYGFAAWGAVQFWRKGADKLVAIIAAHLLLIAATWADWDGRFLVYLLPVITLLAACGIANSCRRYLTARQASPCQLSDLSG
jgi:hypothetical protein